MFTLTYVDLEYENSIYIWVFESMVLLKSSFAFIISWYTIKFTEKNEADFINELWHINLYMNIGISNWHNWKFDCTELKFLILFQFLTLLLTSIHLTLFSTYLVGRNGAMWITCFSASQNAKENQVKHENQVRNILFIDS